jgi:hypothetical protein
MNKDKELICGLIMPISTIDGYSEQHWIDIKNILYKTIEEANFIPNLVSDADDVGIIHKRIIQNIYENPIIVCDVSAKNPNVMFELGLRLAFDKPTIIIKDDKTDYSFDTSAIEHLEYPKDLRFTQIVLFKNKLKEKIKATYDKALSDKDYTTFLKHFGSFTSVKLETKQVSKEDYIIEELKELRSIFNKQHNKINRENTSYNTSEITIRIANTNNFFKVKYHSFEHLQDLLDFIWKKININYNLDLPAYDYGNSWKVYNTTLNLPIKKYKERDYRSLLDSSIEEDDILEVVIE